MKVLNRDVIKYFAIVLMFMDHVIKIFMERGTYAYQILDSLSHFTFVAMSFFLVEGYKYTKSKKRYVKRIFLFGLISQLPYALALSKEGVLGIVPFNVFFTLGFCFLMIWGLDRVNKKFVKASIIIATMIICSLCDWMYYAPLITVLFYWAGDNRKRLVLAFLFDICFFGLMNISGYLFNGDYIMAGIQFLIATSGIVLSGICILGFYNGKRMRTAGKFNKWFFYWFYPIHLLLLGIIRVAML